MGLDSVELLMEWEKAFAIQIPDLEAEQIYCVKDATDVLLRHVQLHPSTECKTQRLFYLFRRYFEENLGIAKGAFQPSTKLNALLPFENRQKIWEKMQHDIGLILPELTQIDLGFKPKPAVSFFGSIWTNHQAYLALTEHTSNDLIGFVFSLNYEQLVALPIVSSRYEVEKVIMGITSDKIGVAIHEIKPESRFVDDLGID